MAAMEAVGMPAAETIGRVDDWWCLGLVLPVVARALETKFQLNKETRFGLNKKTECGLKTKTKFGLQKTSGR